MKSKAKKLLGLIFGAVLIAAPQAFAADAFATQELESEIPQSIVITKTSSQEVGEIAAGTGAHSGLSTNYLLNTNGKNSDYDFVISSNVLIKGNTTVNGFGEDGRLLFTNIDYLPTLDAVDEARKTSPGLNPNVIAYPVRMSVSPTMEIRFEPTNINYGACYIVLPKDSNTGTVNQIIDSRACDRTYEKGTDAQGRYSATITFTAVAIP